ncbi:Mfa1 fimbrilin C-terminal domain-containing protein [Phocaeicola barnesiae]|uniref:Mfa1 family fimbria major subunit n=1 Tax=Phocaeicola barnesiae TaxID=376804 RepID=UPI001F20304C|nr:Mfa1 family fimbria major subunit [Phocaeicola barnesiae]MCF2577301.1 Mfa1 fimbrilin C-terminal domain-containing protein [Phocaeicola barnesiae]
MKLNRLFLLAAMGLGLFACNDNDLVEGSAPNGTQEEGTTYVGLKINFNSSSSRANTGDQPIDGDGDGTLYDDPEDGNEAKVSDVRIVVTDAEGKSQYNAVVTPTANNGNNIYLFKITPGKKKFYAVVNGEALELNETLKSWAGSQLALTKKASELYEYNTTATEGKGFLMSSVEAVEQTLQDNVSEDDVKAGKANNIEITVERVVAKVTMQLSTTLAAPGGFDDQTATLKKLTCQIGNADNLKYNKDGEDDAAKYKTVGTYLMAYDDNDVRTTPYYQYPATGYDFDGFEQSKLLNTDIKTLYENNASSVNPARFYCLENTHANTDSKNYLQSNTTFIRVKAEMIPNSAKQFTYSAGPAPKVTISDRGSMPTDLETFYVITAAPDQDDQGSYVFASDLASLYADLVPDGDADNNDDKAAAVVKALAAYDYNFTAPYTAGCGYYNIWVNDMKDANNQYLNIAPVFRNDWYNLTITSLTLPGSPKESIDPEEPIHPDTNVGVTLTIRDWNKVNHNVDLQ